MKIAINSFETTTELQITGDEPWLNQIYEVFMEEGQITSRITGSLSILREENGSAWVKGHLAFSPLVACGRCAQAVKLPLNVAISARFLSDSENPNRTENWQRERNLTRDDLDTYYMAGGVIDLEQLINDAINTEIPISYIPASDDGKSCRVCLADLTSAHIFGQEQEPKESSPFHALKRLRLKN